MRIEDNFIWFTGVVEDRNDPEQLNRVRVRIFGSHTNDKHDIATADLPWATVMMPTTSSSNSGLGLTLHGLVEGSWVVGFWKDGTSKQDPMIMGSFIGKNDLKTHIVKDIEGIKSVTELGDALTDNDRSTIGFVDPRINHVADYTLTLASGSLTPTPEGINPPHNPTRTTGLTLDLRHSPSKDGWDAVNYPRKDYVNQSDVNKLARPTNPDNVYPSDVINTGGLGKTLFTNKGMEGKDKKGNNEDRKSWVNPKYPFNHVYESESGHVIEIDDTPGYERINLFHRKGARIEINNEGEIHMIAAPGQDMNLQAANVNIQNTGSGSLNVNADCEVNITAKEACTLTSEGPLTTFAKGISKFFSMAETKIISLEKIKLG